MGGSIDKTKIVVNKFCINIESLSSENNIVLYSDDNMLLLPDFYFYKKQLKHPRGMLDVENTQNYAKISFGRKIVDVFTNPGFTLPEIVNKMELIVSTKIFVRTNLEKYLRKSVKENNGNITYWNEENIADTNAIYKTRNFKAILENVPPIEIVSAIGAAIERDSAALGKDAALLDVQAFRLVPALSTGMNKYWQKVI